MTIAFKYSVLLCIIASCASCQPMSRDAKENGAYSKETGKGFVLLELFTSQGCSSCPPADAILSQYILKENSNIIGLAFHVDYWDRLGWKDPFSRRSFTERQAHYASSLGESLYTPQLVINGKTGLVGSNADQIAKLVQEGLDSEAAATLKIISVTMKGDLLEVGYESSDGLPDVINVALVQKRVATVVKRGENGGRTLAGYNIVTEFTSEAAKKNGSISVKVPKSFVPANYKLVLYLQRPNAGEVRAVAQSEITAT